jgi:hypothetical protein
MVECVEVTRPVGGTGTVRFVVGAWRTRRFRRALGTAHDARSWRTHADHAKVAATARAMATPLTAARCRGLVATPTATPTMSSRLTRQEYLISSR